MSFIRKLSKGIDETIGIISPKTYAKRMAHRIAADHAKRFYDGATKGRRGDSWKKSDMNAERVPHNQLQTLRQRGRDFSRNNGYAKKAVSAITANVIGTGVVLQYKSTRTKKKEDKANERWRAWHETKEIDFEGRLTGPAMQTLAFQTMVEAGECFLVRRLVKQKGIGGRDEVKLRIQMLEAEFLDESQHNLYPEQGRNRIVRGIEYNAFDQRVAYHFYTRFPEERALGESVRVDAVDVIHLYRKDRPHQERGVTWAAPIMLNLKDLDDYEDSELVRRKIAACFAGFVSRPEADAQLAINGMVGSPEDLPPLVDRLEPGILEHLGPGEQISFATPPNVTGYQEYVTAILHKIASGFQVPYSVLTGDFSLVDFSSGRMGFLEFQRVIEQWRWSLFIPDVLDTWRVWFEDYQALKGFSYDGYAHEWTAPRREMIDPLKEITAINLQVKSGLITMPEAIKEMGYDPDANLDAIEAWNKLLDEKKIILDSDPRQDPKRLTAQNVALTAKLKDNPPQPSGDKE